MHLMSCFLGTLCILIAIFTGLKSNNLTWTEELNVVILFLMGSVFIYWSL